MSINFDDFFGRPTAPVSAPYFLSAGCSHTSAVGVDADQNWSSQLARSVKIKTCNLAEAGGNAWIASVRIARWIQCTGRPEFVVVQWPHPVRTVIWKNGIGSLATIREAEDPLFQTRLRYSELNFWAEWMQAIITTNAVCTAAKIPILNWSLDPIDFHYKNLLAAGGIQLHDLLWSHDWKGSDGQHHGPLAHERWAKQLQELLNEITTR